MTGIKTGDVLDIDIRGQRMWADVLAPPTPPSKTVLVELNRPASSVGQVRDIKPREIKGIYRKAKGSR